MPRIFAPLLILFTVVVMTVKIVGNMKLLFFAAEHSGIRRGVGIVIIAISGFPSFMIIVSLAMTVLGDPGTTMTSIRKMQEKGILSDDFLKGFPTCDKCGLPKPARCHHCSTCDRCHLKMDHHCPAVGTCIALRNQRPFLVMLNWTKVALNMAFFVSLVVSWLVDEVRFQAIIWVAASVILYIPISMLYSESMKRAKFNITTVEELYSSDTSIYDLGSSENLRQIYGSGAFKMYLPIRSTMTGFEWSNMEMPSNL